MRAKSLILFVIAVGCGLAASIGVSQYMENANGGTEAETAMILVAMADINIGEKLDAQTVKLEEWPKDRVPEGAVYELTEVEGKYPRTRMYAGEPILQPKLMDSNKGSPTVTIPKGFRAVPIKVSIETVGGLIQPGDRVDVLVLLRKSSEVPETGTRTILRDVNVFAVDGATERDIDEDGRARKLGTVMLLLKPPQAESVMLASELGRLFLTLRRPDDDLEVLDDEGQTVRSLLGTSGESADGPTDGQNGRPLNWLDGTVSEPPTTAEPVAEVLIPVDTGPKWKMVILGASGAREFVWDDEKELPIETSAAPNGNGAASTFAPVPSTQPQPPVQPTAPTTPPPSGGSDNGPLPMEESDTDEGLPISPN